MRARIRHHQRGELVGIRGDFGLQIVHADVSVIIAGHGHHFHAAHDRAGRIRAVRGGRDEAHIAMMMAMRVVEAANRQKAGVLALRARIRLERHGVKSCALGQPGLQIAKEVLVALALIARAKRMQRIHFRPAQRHHFGGRVQLHRAGAERDHAAIQRDVLHLQAMQVAHHLRLAVVAVEDGMLQIAALAVMLRGAVQRMLRIEPQRGFRLRDAKDAAQVPEFFLGDALVQSHADGLCVDLPQIDAEKQRALQRIVRIAHLHAERVEEIIAHHVHTGLHQLAGKPHRRAMHAQRDLF